MCDILRKQYLGMSQGRETMKHRRWLEAILWVGVIALAAAPGRAQQAPQEMILYNGTIITEDDHNFTSNLGTVAEPMHIRDGKVLRVGANATIRPMAGPGARQVDLRGRTVIPGLILTHEHPWDWTAVTPPILTKVLSYDDVIIRTLEGSPEENVQALPGALADAVRQAKP